MPLALFLHSLRTQLPPVGIFLGFHAQISDMRLHPRFGNMFPKAAKVAALQRSDVIPDDARNVNTIMQAKITFRGIEAILVGFSDFDYACHALTPSLSESGWGWPSRDPQLKW